MPDLPDHFRFRALCRLFVEPRDPPEDAGPEDEPDSGPRIDTIDAPRTSMDRPRPSRPLF